MVMIWTVKLMLVICIVSSAVLLFAMGFPKNPEKKKIIFGVRDNPKFHEGEAAAKLKAIASSCRKSALIITVLVCVMSVILLFLPESNITVFVLTMLVFGLFVIAIPFGKGNTELKNLKKELGITKTGVVYTDLTNTNVVHSLKLPWIILPTAVALAGTIAAILIDLGVINIVPAVEKYALTMMSLSFLFVALLFLPIAVMMDNTRNMVISKDSNINANYNRAKKKTWADMMISTSWANALFLISYLILIMFVNNDIVMVAAIIVYIVMIMTIVIIGVINQKAVEKRYERDTDLELQDDDDFWILGMFYYNPNDTRLNVEKRFGYGGTVNIAHPAGKVIMIVIALMLIAAIIFIIWGAVTGNLYQAGINVPFG